VTRRIGGAVFITLAALSSSACGVTRTVTVTKTVTVTVTQAQPPLKHLPLRHTGVGPESLGTFALGHGFLYVAATCVGKGTFGVWLNRPELGMSAPCLNSKRKATLKTTSDGVSEPRARIEVDAPAGMKWTLVIFEGPPPAGPHDPTNVWR
jgi:hypothetical protein